MNNWGNVVKANATALTSNGSAIRENERVMESLSAKISKLKATFEELVLGDGGISSFIKGVVDAGTALLKFANSDIGQTILMVGALTEAVNLLSKALSLLSLTKTYKNFADLGGLTVDALKSAKTIKEVGTTLQASASLGWEIIPALGKVGIAIAGVVATVYLLQKANKALYPTIDDLTNKLNTSKTAYEEAENKAKSLKEQIENNKKAIADLQAQGGVEITNSGQIQMLKTETAYLETQLGIAQQMAEIKKEEEKREARKVRDTPTSYTYTTGKVMTAGEIPELQMPEDKTPIKLETIENASLKPVEAINRLTESLAKQREEIIFNQHIIDRYQATLDIYNTKVSNGESVTSEFAEKANEASSEIDRLRNSNSLLYEFGVKPNTEALSNLTQSAQSIIDVGEDADGELKKAIDDSQRLTGVLVETVDASGNTTYSIQSLTDAESENGDQANENAEKNEALNESLSAVSKAMKPVEKAQKEYAKNGKITSDTIIGIQSKAQQLGRDFTDLMSILSDTDSTTQDVNDAFGSMIMQILEASGAFDNLTKDNADLVENLLEGYGVTNAYAVVQGQLAQQADGLVPILNNETNALVKQAQQLTNAKVTANGTEMAMNDFVASVIAGNNNQLDLSSSIANLSELEQKAWATASALRYALSLENYQSQGYVKSKAEFYAKHDAERETDASIRRARNVKPTFDIPTPTTTSGGGSPSGSSKAKDPVEEAKKQAEDFKKLHKQILDDRLKYLDHELKQEVISVEEHNQLKQRAYGQYFSALSSMGIDYNQEQNEFFDEQREWLQKRFEDSIKYEQHLIDRQIKALQKQKDEESDDYDDQIDHLEEKRDKIVDALDEEIDLREEQKDAELDAIKEEQDAIKKKHDEVINNLKTQIDILKEEKSANKEAWDERIAQLDAVNDELEKQKQLEEKLEALAKARATRVKIFKNGRFVYDVDREAVSEAQKNLNEYKEKLRQERAKKSLQDQRDAEQKNYEERIDALEKYKDQQDKYYDEIEKRLDDNYDAVEKKYKDLLDALKKQRDSEKKLYDDKIKNLQKLKKESEKEYQDMIDDLNDLKDSYSDALEDMENVQNGFLDATKAFTYDYSKSMEENLKAFMEYVTGVKDGYKELEQAEKQANASSSGSSSSSGGKDYKDISQFSDPSEQHKAWEEAGSPSSSSYSVPDGHGGSTSSLADKYGGIVTSKYSTSHANGVASIGSDELAIVGENPNKEIVVGSRVNNGTLMSLNRGTGVINAKSTRTLAGLVNSIGGSNNLIDRNTSVVQTFSFDKIVLPNVTNANSFVEALSREFNNRAIQYGNIRR